MDMFFDVYIGIEIEIVEESTCKEQNVMIYIYLDILDYELAHFRYCTIVLDS